jgi:hypothetical protein
MKDDLDDEASPIPYYLTNNNGSGWGVWLLIILLTVVYLIFKLV